jgi:tetratricopeptide (TPR) repeat protein
MDVDKQLDQQRLDQLTAMKSAFATGRYPAVLEALEQLGPLDAIRSGIRIEAIALAARTQIAVGEKRAARDLLKQVWNASLKNHRLYRHVAMACLELGEYRRALSLIEKAVELKETTPAT